MRSLRTNCNDERTIGEAQVPQRIERGLDVRDSVETLKE